MTRLKMRKWDKLAKILSGLDGKLVNRDELDKALKIKELDEQVNGGLIDGKLSVMGNISQNVDKRKFKNHKRLR